MFSGRQTFYDQWKNLYSLELHTSRKRLLPADCSAVPFLDQIQWNSQLAVRLYLPVRLHSLHWQKFLLLHFLIPFFSRPPLFHVPSLSPHSLSHLFLELYHVSKLIIQCPYIFWQKQVEQYTSPSQTCKHWDARRLSTKWKCSHLEVTANVDLSFPTSWNFAVSELFSKVSASKRLHSQGTVRLHSQGFAQGTNWTVIFQNWKFFKFCLEHSKVHRIAFKDWHCGIGSCLYFEII